MVMPIAEAVLQQLICTGLADSHNSSDTAEATEDDSGMPGSVTAGGGAGGVIELGKLPGEDFKQMLKALLAPTALIDCVDNWGEVQQCCSSSEKRYAENVTC